MTTAAWSTVIDQSSDAGFRAWGSELNVKFAAVGMVQTADTGQINWTTVTRQASTNTAAGYEIWRLSSSNLYFKIEYGTGSTTLTFPSLWLTVGTGSNGSGALTGQLSTRTQAGTSSVAIASTVTNYQSYLCATANYFGLSWKIGSQAVANKSRCYMGACQTVDASGAATAVGFFTWANGTAVNVLQNQSVATTAGVTGAALSGNNFMLVPNNSANPPASSLDGSGNNQAFLWWHSILGTTPMTPLLHVANVLASDLGLGVTASMTLVGTTPHTYIDASFSQNQDAAAVIASISLGSLMLYE